MKVIDFGGQKMFKTVLKLIMVSMMFMMFACADETGGGGTGDDTGDGGGGNGGVIPAITDASISYATSVDTVSSSPTITATGHTLEASHFDWAITAGDNLATIGKTTSIITVTDPTTTVGGEITVTATFNNSYTGGTLAEPLTIKVKIQRGSNNLNLNGEVKWDGITETLITEEANVFKILNGANLAWVALESKTTNFSGKTIKFMNDVDMDNKSFTGIEEFSGTIDGNGKRIGNLMIDRRIGSVQTVGLILKSKNAVINNLTISSGHIQGRTNVGSFVGAKTDGNLTIKNSINHARVTATSNAGGFVGGTDSGDKITIDNSSNTGDITGKGSVGGLIGYLSGTAIISNSFNTSDVSDGTYTGGLVGQSSTLTIDNSSNTGAVTGGERHAGGLVGEGGNTTLRNVFSYAATIINDGPPYDKGGLVGQNLFTITIDNGYWLEVVGVNKAIGSGDAEAGSTSAELTVDTFKAEGSFVDWDFAKTWEMKANAKYPTLQSVK